MAELGAGVFGAVCFIAFYLVAAKLSGYQRGKRMTWQQQGTTALPFAARRCAHHCCVSIETAEAAMTTEELSEHHCRNI